MLLSLAMRIRRLGIAAQVAASAFMVGPVCALMLGSFGCAVIDSRTLSPNPVIAPTNDFEIVWRETLAVVDDYFEIESENRLARRIVTKPQSAATLLEPWRGDSVGLDQRLEATLQTIRRFAIVTVKPASTGGYAVKVEVFKELEDLPQIDPNALGGISFEDDFALVSDGEEQASYEAGRETAAKGIQWIPRGRDFELESVILERIRQSLFLP